MKKTDEQNANRDFFFKVVGRTESAIKRDSENIGFFVKSKARQTSPQTSTVAYRTETLKQKGHTIAYDNDFNSYDDILNQEKQTKQDLDKETAIGLELMSYKVKRQNMEKQRDLNLKMNCTKQRRHQIQHEYRVTKSANPNGVLGLEQPAAETHSKSHLYGDLNENLS